MSGERGEKSGRWVMLIPFLIWAVSLLIKEILRAPVLRKLLAELFVLCVRQKLLPVKRPVKRIIISSPLTDLMVQN